MESYSLQQGKAKVRCPDGFVLSVLSHFKYQGYLKENKQPINRNNSVLWAPHLGCLFLRGERLDFDRRGKRQKRKTLALKSLMSRFPTKDQISLLFMLFHDVWHYLKAPTQKLQKELGGLLFSSVEWCCYNYICLKYTCFLSWQTYVRDIYPFRRSVSPQLNLVQMHPEKGQELIQKQVSYCHQTPLPRNKRLFFFFSPLKAFTHAAYR